MPQRAPQPGAPNTAAPPDAGGTPPRRPRTPQDDRWARVIRALSRTNGKQFNLGALLRDVQTAEVQGETLQLTFRNSSMEQRVAAELADARGRSPVESAVQEAYDVKLVVAIAGREAGSQPGAAMSAMDSPLVRAAVTMGGRIVDEAADPRAGQDAGARPGPDTGSPDPGTPVTGTGEPQEPTDGESDT